MKIKRAGSRPARSSDSEETPAFPVWKAFAVQFSREARSHTGIFSGRVEHLSSGRRARFASAPELIAVLDKLLGELGENT